MIDPKEEQRLEAVKQYLKQFPANRNKLQDIVDLASQLTGVPVAFITLIDRDIQWLTVTHGYDADQMPRNTSFCTHAIQQDEIMVVPDASIDKRFAENPLVVDAPAVKYYAGISLKSTTGHNVGTLCVMDVKTHELSEQQLDALKALSRQVTHILELNITVQHLQEIIEQVESKNQALREIAKLQSHDIREPLTSVMGVMNVLKIDEELSGKKYFGYLESAVNRLDQQIRKIVSISYNAYSD